MIPKIDDNNRGDYVGDKSCCCWDNCYVNALPGGALPLADEESCGDGLVWGSSSVTIDDSESVESFRFYPTKRKCNNKLSNALLTHKTKTQLLVNWLVFISKD